MITSYMRDRIQTFINKYPRRILKIRPRYVILQAKEDTMRIYYNGVVLIGRSTAKFEFDEKKIGKMM